LRLVRHCFIAFTAVFTSLNCSAIDFDDPVKLATHNLAPYGSYPDDQPKEYVAGPQFKGQAVDTVRCAFSQLKLPLEIYVAPWKRAQELALSGEMDGFFAASQKPERDRFAQMSITIAEQNWTWFFLKEATLKPSNLTFKQHASVASFNGANMQSWLQNNNYKVSANPIDTNKLHQMLLRGRIDAALANNLVMGELLKQTKTSGKIESSLLMNKPLSVYFTNRFLDTAPQFLNAFNQAVTQCRKSSS